MKPGIGRSLEKLIELANVECMIILLKTLSKNWRGAVTNRFSYHVLHKALERCRVEPFCDDILISDFIMNLWDHVLSSLKKYVDHPQAEQIIRFCLQVVMGVQLMKDPKRNAYDISQTKVCHCFDPESEKTLEKLIRTFLLTKDLNDYVRNVRISPFVQVLLLVSSVRSAAFLSQHFNEIVNNAGILRSENDSILPVGFTDNTMVYFTEVLISIMPGKWFASLMRDHIFNEFTGEDGLTTTSLCLMITDQAASRVLRAVIRRLKKPPDMHALLTALNREGTGGKQFARILETGQHAVLNDLAKMCAENDSAELQETFFSMLSEALGLSSAKPSSKSGEDPLIRCVVALKTIGSVRKDTRNYSEDPRGNTGSNSECTLPGCLLTETLLRFTHAAPKLLAASLCTQSPQRLNEWAKDQMLSRVLEAFLETSSVSGNRKMTLFNILKPNLVSLSCDRNGSHVVESLWSATDQMPQAKECKLNFLEALVPSFEKIKSNRFGSFVSAKLRLSLYVSNRAQWERSMFSKTASKTAMKARLEVTTTQKHALAQAAEDKGHQKKRKKNAGRSVND
ncbi:unnamed protein product [Calicophoron daubneyi]